MDTRGTSKLILTLVIAAGLSLPGSRVFAQSGKGSSKSASRILYHNGQLMTGTTNLYFIWYGCWTCSFPGSDATTQDQMTRFAVGIGDSPYARINTTYSDGSGRTPSGNFVYGGAIADEYSHGIALSETDVADLIEAHFNNGGLPVDPRGVYVVLLSSDVYIEGLTEGRCQYHRAAEVNGSMIKHAVIANPQRAPTLCAPQFVDSDGTLLATPNDNLAFDAMASWLAHVLDGSVTNPTGLGWYDRYGLENSDKCQGTFGQTYITLNGARANMVIRGMEVLIQQNWVNDGRGYCGLAW